MLGEIANNGIFCLGEHKINERNKMPIFNF